MQPIREVLRLLLALAAITVLVLGAAYFSGVFEERLDAPWDHGEHPDDMVPSDAE